MGICKLLALKTCQLLFAAMVLFGSGAAALANNYPEKPIFLIVPFAAGGATDILARTVAERLGNVIGQRVLVDNRPGGGGLVGADFVARAPKDGYTLLLHTTTLAILGATKKGAGFDVKRDLAPVSLLASGPFVLASNTSLPAANAAELIAYAKANKGKLNFGSPGAGTSVHLAGELFKAMAGIDSLHVPYRGNSPALVALMTNDIQYMFDTLATAKPLADDNKIRILAVSTKERSAFLPAVPTISESGLPRYESGVWMGILAPSGTNPEIISKLSLALRGILMAGEVKKQLDAQGLEPKPLSPEEFGVRLTEDIDQFATLIREQKLEIE